MNVLYLSVKPYWFRWWGWRWRLSAWCFRLAWWLRCGGPTPRTFASVYDGRKQGQIRLEGLDT